MRELLIGCGSRTSKDLSVTGVHTFENVVRLDNNADHNPDVLWDLRKHPLPFIDNEFDEIHAYEVLEHLATQGDYEFFFREFTEYARILKTNGLFFASVPAGKWVWGDPSHKRCIQKETLIFLNQDEYKQVGQTAMSDFRYLYKANFRLVFEKITEARYSFILEKR
jgi:predicted SAM-dependent methyltransferase